MKYEILEPFVRDFVVDKNGYNKRWQKDGSGYSDHLPLVAKFESNPKAVHVQDVTIEDIFSGRENVRFKSATVIHVSTDGFVLGVNCRGVHVYRAWFFLPRGAVVYVVVLKVGC